MPNMAPNFNPTLIPELPNSPACSSREGFGFFGGDHIHWLGSGTEARRTRRFEIRKRPVTPLQVIFKQGETDMGDKGKRDKGKREQQKKAKLTPKEKRKLKREKKNK